MKEFLSEIGMLSVSLIILFFIMKIYQHFDQGEFKIYRFEDDEDDD